VYGHFQQKSTTTHTVRHFKQALHEVFDDKFVSRGLWPPRSPDINPCDFFFLWGYLKDKVYADNPHSSEELKQSVQFLVSQKEQRTFTACGSQRV
jgi:hypothetical protein